MGEKMFNTQTTVKPRVLIAEKDGIIATDLQMMFKIWGFEEPSISNSMDNLINKTNSDNYDIVVIDENCQSSRSWIHTIKHFLKEYESVVVFLSDFINTHLPETLMAEKSFFLLPKPFNQSELQSIASSAFNRH